MRAGDRITPHFTFGEVTARWRDGVLVQGVDLAALQAHPDSALHIAALRRVCGVAEQIRSAVGRPVFVTSGYRYLSGSQRVTSQHQVGQALDLQVRGMSPRELLRVVRKLQIDDLRQVIAETTRERAALDGSMEEGSGRWLHVAVLGVGEEEYARTSSLPWSESWAPPPNERRPYVAV